MSLFNECNVRLLLFVEGYLSKYDWLKNKPEFVLKHVALTETNNYISFLLVEK